MAHFAASAITYRVRVWTADFAADERVRDLIRTRIYYAFRRHGVTIPYPIQVQIEQGVSGGPGDVALTLARESLASQAAAWINSSLYGLPADYAERASERAGAVDSAAVRSSAARWLDPARAGLVVVGPAARLEPILERLGPVEVVSASSPPVAIPVRPSLDTAAARPEQRTRGAALVRQALAAHGAPDATVVESEVTLEDVFLRVVREGSQQVGRMEGAA